MRESSGPSQPFRLDERQQQIYDRLERLVGQGAADHYWTACDVAADELPLPSQTHVIAHMMREVESSLRDVLDPDVATAKGKNDREGHERSIRAVLRSLEVDKDDGLAVTWLRLVSETPMAAMAHREALAAARRADDGFWRWWREIQSVIDGVLARFEDCFANVFPVLDGLIALENPTAKDATTFSNRVPATLATYRYFFSRLETPAWLRVLKDEPVFRRVPEPATSADGTVRVSGWPQAEYLIRMAEHEPGVVCQIIMAIDTTNVYVACKFIDAAVKLPPALATRLVAKAQRWLSVPLGSPLPERLGRLMSYLAHAGQVDGALALAPELLRIQARERAGGMEAKARFRDSLYAKILQRDVPALVAAAHDRTITLLCQTLAEAVRCSLPESWREQGGAARDVSETWRKFVGVPRSYNRHEVKNVLVSAITTAVQQAIETDVARLAPLVRLVESFQWPVFRRIALYVLQSFPEVGRQLIVERLTDRELLATADVCPEYDELAAASFARLSRPEQRAVLDLVDGGPHLRDDWLAGASDQDIADRNDRWKRDRVAPYADALPGEWRNRFDDWVQHYGPPRPHDLEVEAAWIGQTSPQGRDDLAAMSIDNIVGFLRTWKPTGGVEEPSPRGLRETIEDVVGDDPVRFADAAERFEGVDATYIAGLASGFRKAVRAGHAFDWEKVLRLFRWAGQQPREILGRDTEHAAFGDLDPHWGWARQSIAMLLQDGFHSESTAAIPFNLRPLAWEVLEPITRDPDPSVADDERRRNESNQDPMTSSINCTRGHAMHAVFAYSVWVRHHLDAESAAEAVGLDLMPEVRDTIEQHLDVTTDPSPAVRAVYGDHVNTLAYLDREWLSRSVDRIFPPAPGLQHLRDAAWETYLVYGRFSKFTFAAVRREYERAVDQLSPTDEATDGMRDPTTMLAQHLMLFYCWGELALEDADGLLRRFFDNAAPGHRAHALRHIGTLIGGGDIPAAVRQRLQDLWTHRLDQAQTDDDPQKHGGEMEAFGWWFISDLFDERWAVEQLFAALRVYPRTEMDHDVVVRLANGSANYPLQAVSCARRMCEGDDEGWLISSWTDSLKQILATAISSDDSAAQETGHALISYLASRGFDDFRGLLPAA